MTSTEKAACWQQHFTDWQQSGLSQQDYFKQHDLTYSSFGYWPKTGETLSLTGQELNWLLDGFDIFNNQPHSRLLFDSVS